MSRTTTRRAAPEHVRIADLAADHYAPVDPVAPDAPVVFVHGAMDRAAGFRRTSVHLPHREVVAYDRRGYAGSIDVPVASDLARHVDDLVAVCAGFDRPPLVVGHSMGGLIALLALSRPDAATFTVGAVVWECPLPWHDWYRSRGDGLRGLPPDEAAERFMRGVLGESLWDRLPARMRDERRAEGAALLADLDGSHRADAVVDYAAIGLPVLAGHGTESAPYHQRAAAEVAASVPGAHLRVIDGADHGVHLSSPRAFADLVGEWG